MSETRELKKKLSLSFASKKTGVPINQLFDSWEACGLEPTKQAVVALVEYNHMVQSQHFNIIKSTFQYLYQNLAPIYGEYSPELYQAIDEVLPQIVQVDANLMLLQVQRKIDQRRGIQVSQSLQAQHFDEQRQRKMAEATPIENVQPNPLPVVEFVESPAPVMSVPPVVAAPVVSAPPLPVQAPVSESQQENSNLLNHQFGLLFAASGDAGQ